MPASLELEQKKDLILQNEKRFCHRVSAAILDKPEVGVWMILIPVFFIFHFWQLKRYADGRKDFARNFLLTRQRALEAAHRSIVTGTEIEIDMLVEAPDVPEETRTQYRDWVTLLTRHYKKLLVGKGDKFSELVRSSYSRKSQYRQFLDGLNQVEKAFNAKLEPHLGPSDSDVKDIIGQMESISSTIRQQDLKEIYS